MRRAVSSPIMKASRLAALAATATLPTAPVEAQTIVDYDTGVDVLEGAAG